MYKSRLSDIGMRMEDEDDPRNRTRTVPMRVLVLGYPRTGTSSVQKALEDLGYGPCYHMRTAISERPRDCVLWTEAMRAKYDGVGRPYEVGDFDHLLGDFSSVVDIPAAALGPELMRAYPLAKIILTNRSPDSWHVSMTNTLDKSRHYWLYGVLQHLDWVSSVVHTMRKTLWRCMFDDDFAKNGKPAMERHNNDIRQAARELGRDVLEFHPSQGWSPLCKFLEADIPDRPFPHMNEKGDFLIKMRHRAWSRFHLVLRRASILGAPLVTILAALAWMRYQHQ